MVSGKQMVMIIFTMLKNTLTINIIQMAKQVTTTKYVSELTEEMINEGWNRCGKLNDKLMVIKEDNVSENSDTLNEVISDMIAREKLGLKKYGTTIDRDDYSLLEWTRHHYEELLDAALYVKKQIQILENKNK